MFQVYNSWIWYSEPIFFIENSKVFLFRNKIVYFVFKAFSYIMRKLSERTSFDLFVNFLTVFIIWDCNKSITFIQNPYTTIFPSFNFLKSFSFFFGDVMKHFGVNILRMDITLFNFFYKCFLTMRVSCFNSKIGRF